MAAPSVTINIPAPAVQLPTVMSEYCMLKFNVLGNRKGGTTTDIIPWVANLLLTNEKASLIFSEVVACRTTVATSSIPGGIRHELILCECKGPFTCEQFLKMITFTPGISNDTWLAHMNSFIPS